MMKNGAVKTPLPGQVMRNGNYVYPIRMISKEEQLAIKKAELEEQFKIDDMNMK